MKKLGLLAALVFVLFSGSEAFACLCRKSSPEEKFTSADSVFIATVQSAVDIQPNRYRMIEGQRREVTGPGRIEAILKVEKSYKHAGKDKPVVMIETDNQGSACGVDEWLQPEAKQQQWLVYASLIKGRAGKNLFKWIFPFLKGKILLTSRCDGTREVEYSQENLDFLNTLGTSRNN